MPLLDDQGYAAFSHPALHFHPGNYRQAGNFTGSKGDLNLLCVPRERLEGEHANVWQALHPAVEWAGVSADGSVPVALLMPHQKAHPRWGGLASTRP
jgi:hypothetical protein